MIYNYNRYKKALNKDHLENAGLRFRVLADVDQQWLKQVNLCRAPCQYLKIPAAKSRAHPNAFSLHRQPYLDIFAPAVSSGDYSSGTGQGSPGGTRCETFNNSERQVR